jgi:hypothetical protein
VSVYIRAELKRQIRDYFGECCAYCRTAEFLTAMTFEFEHIQPLSAGGKSIFENLCFACPPCNRHKSDRRTVIDLDTGQQVTLFHPQSQIWTKHFAWDDPNTTIVGLTTVGRATITALEMNRPALVRARAIWVKLGEHPPQLDQAR